MGFLVSTCLFFSHSSFCSSMCILLSVCVLGGVVNNVLYMSIKYKWSIVPFRTYVPLLIFFFFLLDDLPIDIIGVLKSPIIILLSVSPFRSLSMCFISLGLPVLGMCTLMSITLYRHMILLSPSTAFVLKFGLI